MKNNHVTDVANDCDNRFFSSKSYQSLNGLKSSWENQHDDNGSDQMNVIISV